MSLGNDELTHLTWGEIRRLQKAAPDADFLYSFHLYEKEFSLDDKEMDLNHITMYDNGDLVRQVIACMPNLRYLDMDQCNVDNEHMEKIRDEFPDIKVVWRIWFGSNYSVRTDVKKILASMPSVGGNLQISNTRALKYCTEVKYLDIGHNEELQDISFTAYMPDLEVAIFAMLNVKDISDGTGAAVDRKVYSDSGRSGTGNAETCSGLCNRSGSHRSSRRVAVRK